MGYTKLWFVMFRQYTDIKCTGNSVFDKVSKLLGMQQKYKNNKICNCELLVDAVSLAYTSRSIHSLSVPTTLPSSNFKRIKKRAVNTTYMNAYT